MYKRQVLLCNKLQKIYLDLLEGRMVQLPPAPEYRLHVSEEQQYLQSAACRKDEAYWAALFEQSCEPASLQQLSLIHI